jgi:hypothetical protein
MNALEVIDRLCDLLEGLEGRFDWGSDEQGPYLDLISDKNFVCIRYHTFDIEYAGVFYEADAALDIQLRKNLRGIIGWLEEHHMADFTPRPYTPINVSFSWHKSGNLNIRWQVQTRKGQPTFQANKEPVEIQQEEFPLLNEARQRERSDP